MKALLEMKQRLKIFYSQYDIYLIPAVKFAFAFSAFLLINKQVGFMEKFAGPEVSLLLALLCSFLPVNMIAVFGAILICVHAFALSLEVFAMTVGLLFIMYGIYCRIAPGYGYVLILTPAAFFLNIPYALPLTLGLTGGPVCAVPMAFGILVYNLMYYMKNNTTMLSSSDTEQMISRLTYLVENVLNNKNVILTILVFALTLMIVYAVRRMNVDYAWYFAIGTGAVANVVLFLLGALVMEVDVPIGPLMLETLAAVGIALVVEFLAFNVDYSRTEYTQFEDDEYYYYVKAVPKMSIAVPEKKVKKINSRHKNNRRRH